MKYRSSFAALVFAALPATLLLSMNSAHAESGSAAASSSVDFQFSFSDSLSHVDPNWNYTVWVATAYGSYDYVHLYSKTLSGAVTDKYTGSKDGLSATSISMLNQYGGSLKSDATASSFFLADAASPVSTACTLYRVGCVDSATSYQARLVLMPGATLTFSGSYEMQGAVSVLSNESAYALTHAGYDLYSEDRPVTLLHSIKRGETSASTPSFSLGGEFLSSSYTNMTGEAEGLYFSFGADTFVGGLQTAVTPVPEPQTWAMFFAGLLALAPVARSRRARVPLAS